MGDDVPKNEKEEKGRRKREALGNDELNFDVMLRWVKEMMRVLPTPMSVVIKFACLTGLRPSQAVESVRLINDKEAFSKYYNSTRGALEHFKFPVLFLRSTKKTSWLRQSRVESEIIDLCKDVYLNRSFHAIISCPA